LPGTKKFNVSKESTIRIDVGLDETNVPQTIHWNATDSTAMERQVAKAMMINFWDGQDKAALRIDLWTNEMMIDEMADFYYQTFMGMADSFQRSTGETELVDEMKNFAREFFRKFQENQRKASK
jgi:gliding motility-associated protein GldC